MIDKREAILSNKNRARLKILSELLSFPTIRNKDWTSGDWGDSVAKCGDLVAMSAAQPSKWYLSWLRDVQEKDGWTHYLLESVDDGELCWWHNIGLAFYNRERVAICQDWQWTDRQFAFRDRWFRVCKKHDAYIIRPVSPIFGDNFEVVLDVRVMHSMSPFRRPMVFDDWRKVTKKMMSEFYLESVKKYDQSAD